MFIKEIIFLKTKLYKRNISLIKLSINLINNHLNNFMKESWGLK